MSNTININHYGSHHHHHQYQQHYNLHQQQQEKTTRTTITIRLILIQPIITSHFAIVLFYFLLPGCARAISPFFPCLFVSPSVALSSSISSLKQSTDTHTIVTKMFSIPHKHTVQTWLIRLHHIVLLYILFYLFLPSHVSINVRTRKQQKKIKENNKN